MKISLIGAILGIGSGVGVALISIFAKFSANKGYSSFTTQFYSFVFASAIAFPIAKGWEVPAVIAGDYISIVYILSFALIATALPYVLYGMSLKKVSASVGSILSSFEVIVGAVVGAIAYRENIGFLGVVGIIVMMVGMVFLAFSEKEKEDEEIKSETTE